MDQQTIATGNSWAHRTNEWLLSVLHLMAPIIERAQFSAEQAETVMNLTTAAARGSQSVLLLAAAGQLWDAEMVLRSVNEASIKFAYLLSDKSLFAERHEEFATAQFEISQLKDDRKAREFLAEVPDRDAPKWRNIRELQLTDAKRAEYSERYDRKYRARLEQRWGFGGLLIAMSTAPEPRFKLLSGFAHGYSLASHLQHADYVGVSLPKDRAARTAAEQPVMHLAHLARILSDVAASFVLRVLAGYRFVDLGDDIPKKLADDFFQLTRSFGDAYGNWARVQYGEE